MSKSILNRELSLILLKNLECLSIKLELNKMMKLTVSFCIKS